MYIRLLFYDLVDSVLAEGEKRSNKPQNVSSVSSFLAAPSGVAEGNTVAQHSSSTRVSSTEFANLLRPQRYNAPCHFFVSSSSGSFPVIVIDETFVQPCSSNSMVLLAAGGEASHDGGPGNCENYIGWTSRRCVHSCFSNPLPSSCSLATVGFSLVMISQCMELACLNMQLGSPPLCPVAPISPSLLSLNCCEPPSAVRFSPQLSFPFVCSLLRMLVSFLAVFSQVNCISSSCAIQHTGYYEYRYEPVSVLCLPSSFFTRVLCLMCSSPYVDVPLSELVFWWSEHFLVHFF